MKRVLLIEDHPDTLDFYTSCVAMAGFEPTACMTGAEGIAAFAQAQADGIPFDAVITDLEIDAHESGVSVARSIREMAPNALIVLATGRKDDHIVFMANELNIFAVWRKPITNFEQKLRDLIPMPTSATVDRRPQGFVRRQFQSLNETKQGTLILFVLLFICILQIRSTWMAPQLYSQIGNIQNAASTIDKKLDGAVATGALPSGYQVFVPRGEVGYQVMKSTGRSRVTFEFESKDAAAAESLAKERGAPLWVQVTRGK